MLLWYALRWIWKTFKNCLFQIKVLPIALVMNYQKKYCATRCDSYSTGKFQQMSYFFDWKLRKLINVIMNEKLLGCPQGTRKWVKIFLINQEIPFGYQRFDVQWKICLIKLIDVIFFSKVNLIKCNQKTVWKPIRGNNCRIHQRWNWNKSVWNELMIDVGWRATETSCYMEPIAVTCIQMFERKSEILRN